MKNMLKIWTNFTTTRYLCDFFGKMESSPNFQLFTGINALFLQTTPAINASVTPSRDKQEHRKFFRNALLDPVFSGNPPIFSKSGTPIGHIGQKRRASSAYSFASTKSNDSR